MTKKKIDELNQPTEPTQEEIKQWHTDWEVIAAKADKTYKEVLERFGLSGKNSENK